MKTLRLQAVAAATIVAAALLAGCGGGGGGAVPAAVTPATTSPSTAPLNTATSSGSFAFTGDSYGMENATYLAATTSGNGLVLRAAVASGMTDPDFRTVARIDIPDPGAVAAAKTYSLGASNGSSAPFPGTLYFFNGHQSSLLRTAGGSITFKAYGSNPGETISGSFSAVIVDDGTLPAASYTVAADFTFVSGASGQILPAQLPVPAAALSVYGARCATCHSLGSIDPSQESAPELGLKGGRLESFFPAGAAGHKGITLADTDIAAVKILLNAN